MSAFVSHQSECCLWYLFNRINRTGIIIHIYYLQALSTSLSIYSHYYYISPVSSPGQNQEPMTVVQRILPAMCATNCLFRASNDEVSNTPFVSAYKRNCEHRRTVIPRAPHLLPFRDGQNKSVQGCVIARSELTQPNTNFCGHL